MAVAGVGCGGSGAPSAQVDSVGPRQEIETQASDQAAQVDVERFRDIAYGAPFMSVLDWTAPEELDGFTALPEYGGTIAGVVKGAEASPADQVDYFDAPDLPNDGRMRTGGVDLLVELDAVGVGLEEVYGKGATVRVRIEMWVVGSGPSQVGEAAVERALEVVPIGARVIVPLMASRSTRDTVVPLLGTPFFANPGGVPIAIDPRVDAIAATPDLQARLAATVPNATPR
jgi:hypothetical protein